MLAFFFECLEPGIAIDRDRLAVAFRGFAGVIPRSGSGTDVIRIGGGIEYANRRARCLIAFAFVIVAMHVGNPESSCILGCALRLISGPARWRIRQDREQLLIIDYVRDKNWLVLRAHDSSCEDDEQCEHKESGT